MSTIEVKTGNKTGAALFVPIMAMIAGANFIAMMNTTTVTILLPVFMREFQVDIITAQWVVTTYILATCTIAPVVGYISDRISLKRTFLLALLGFAVFTLCLGLMGNIYMLIAMRTLQGLFGGMIMPLTQALIYQVFPRQKQAQAISIWATTNLLAPTIAPSLAGVISDAFGWRWIFFSVVPVLMLVLCAAIRLIPAYRVVADTERHAFDFVGLALSVVGSVCLLLAFSNITVWGLYSAPVILLTIIGAVSLVGFFYWEAKNPFPMLYVKVFGYEGFLSSVVLLCIGSILINASNNITPIFLQNIKELSTTQAALVMLPAPLVIMFLVPLLGKYYDRIGPRPMLYGIMTFGVIACIAMGQVHVTTGVPFMIGALILRDLGSGSLNMPATNMGMQAVPREYATHAAAVTSWARQCVIALTVGLVNTFQTARTNAYMATLLDVEESMRYKISYSNAMDEVFHGLILCFLIGYGAVYFSKSRRKAER